LDNKVFDIMVKIYLIILSVSREITWFWPTLDLQCGWVLEPNFCSRRRGFRFTGQCTEAEYIWSIKVPYIV